MEKHLHIDSQEQIAYLKSTLKQTAESTRLQLLDFAGRQTSIDFLGSLKFRKVGCDPLDSSRQLNLIEQLNQTFTYLASLLAVEYLLEKHPNAAPFALNLGTKAGYDIESNRDEGVVAEVFAAVNPNNNRKLKKDVEKVSYAKFKAKYVFFLCPECEAGKRESNPQHPEVLIRSLGFDNY